MFTTKLKAVSIGIVVEDKKINTNTIKVYPVELLPCFDGSLEPTETELESTGEDIEGDLYSVNIKVANYIEAEWLEDKLNRVSSPDVVKGEQVILWSYGDCTDYYWESMGRDKNLRKLETIIYAISNISENDGDVVKGLDNQYIIEWSTHGKHLTIKTSKSDGEEYAYTIQLNTKDSCFIVKDDAENIFFLDSDNTEIRMENHDGTYLTLDGKDIKMYAPEDITISAEGNVEVKAEGFIDVTAEETIALTSKEKMTFTSHDTYEVNAKSNIIINGESAVNLKSSSDMSLNSGSGLSLSSSGSTSIDSGGSLSASSSSGMTLSSGGATSITSPSRTSITSPSIALNGNVSIGGGRQSEEGDKSSGDLSIDGRLSVGRSASINETLTAKTVTADKVDAKTVDADKIEAGDIKADSISANKMDATRFDGNFYGTLYGNTVP